MNTKKIFFGLTFGGLLFWLLRRDNSMLDNNYSQPALSNNVNDDIPDEPLFSAHGLSSLYMNNYDFSYEVGQSLADGCQMLISSLSNDVKNNNYQIFLGTFGFNNLYLYEGCAYPAYPMSQYSAFTIMNVANGSRYKFGYNAFNWYFQAIG